MHNGNLAAKILENFPHQATPEQLQVVHLWEDFLLSRDADRIFVLQNGIVAETGTHADLMAKNGIYRHLYELREE